VESEKWKVKGEKWKVEGGRGKGKEGFEDSRVQVIMFLHFY